MTLGGAPTVPLVGNHGSRSERNSSRFDHRQHVRQAIHERIDAIEACHHVRRLTRQGPGPARMTGVAGVRPAIPDRHIFAGLQPGQRIPSRWLIPGVIVQAEFLRSWPARAELPADELTATVQRFNALPGPVSTRTTTAGVCLRSLGHGDPSNKPNQPRRGRPPAHYGAKMVPGDQTRRHPHRCQRTCSGGRWQHHHLAFTLQAMSVPQ